MTKTILTGSMLHEECIARGITKVLVYPKYMKCGCVKEFPMNKDLDFLLQCDSSRIDSFNFSVIRGVAKLELIYGYNETCYLCYRNRCVYCDELDRPAGFEDMRIYHGIAAYEVCGIHKLEDYMNRVCDLIQHPEWQICCSTTYIGHIGVVVKGDVLAASNADLCSQIDRINGRRYFDASTFRASCLVKHANELDSSVWSHNEIISQNNHVCCIWVNANAPEEIKDFAMVIARKLNLGCVFVNDVLIPE